MCRKGHGQIVGLVLEHGGKALLKDVNKRGLTPLGEAVVAGHTTIADQLIKAGILLPQIQSNRPAVRGPGEECD